jgi:simple sugar transport system permease protein
MSAPIDLPRWADTALVPAASVVAAFLVAGLVVIGIGENPLTATRWLIQGSLGLRRGLASPCSMPRTSSSRGFAVAVAYHAGLFNIGGEGQATLGGLGAALAVLHFSTLPGYLLLPLGILAAAAFGALWAAIRAISRPGRGSHIVITTIMFKLARQRAARLPPRERAARGQLHEPGDARLPARNPGSRSCTRPSRPSGSRSRPPQLNLSFVLALAAALAVWLLIYRSRLGYAIRVVGSNPNAAVYAGISPARITIIAMVISGALAAGLAVNELMGYQHRLLLEFTSGYGFVGIAVALMGRAHPVGIILASILFGILYQGGAELAFEQPAITRDMVVVIGGVIILFAGALDGLFRRIVAHLLPRPDLAQA